MKKTWWLQTTLILVCLKSIHSDISIPTKDKITTSVGAVISVADKIEKQTSALRGAGKSISPLMGNIGKMAPFLGIAGAFLGVVLAFLPRADSVELAYMKAQFAFVNQKLDKISRKLDLIEDIIKFEVQRQHYIHSEHTINYGFQRLEEMYDRFNQTSCNTTSECETKRLNIATQEFLKHFEGVEFAIYQILTGAVDASIFKEPLLDLVRQTYKCDINKLTEFTEGILRMAERGQQVVITYLKLTASETSVVASLKKYLAAVYKLREEYYAQKNACIKEFKLAVSTDALSMYYQTEFTDHEAAGNALANKLESKFGWLKWNILTYHASGFKKHAYLYRSGAYLNIPDSSHDRKRIMMVAPVDPFGTYDSSVKVKMIDAIREKLIDNKNTYGCHNDKSQCREQIEDALKAKDLYNKIYSLVVLRTDVDIVIRKSDGKDVMENSYINEEFEFLKYSASLILKDKVRVVIFLKRGSPTNPGCDPSCYSRGGICKQLPYSTLSECQCKVNYDGDGCRDLNNNDLAASLDLVITETMKVPTLVDIYSNVNELRDEINYGFTRLETGITHLAVALETSYKRILRELAQHFQWTNLRVNYAETISRIVHFSEEFLRRSRREEDKRGKALARHIVAPGNVRYWIQELNTLFYGSENIVQYHKPFMVMYIDRYVSEACSVSYKKRIDEAYKQFAVLQQQAFTLWLKSLAILEEDTEEATQRYIKTLNDQYKELNTITCKLDIVGSTNQRCASDRYGYIHYGTKLNVTCQPNHYLKGSLQVECGAKTIPQCPSCSCNRYGSSGTECADQTGQCKCKSKQWRITKTKSSKYYGQKCDSLDCQWASWNSWTTCKTCNYDTQRRYRTYEVARYGKGKCSGSSRQYNTCPFKGCCNNYFHCSKDKRCISDRYRCDYRSNCKDKTDEDNCQEECKDYTKMNKVQNPGTAYLLGHTIGCPGADQVLQRLTWHNSVNNAFYFSIKYRCCKINKYIALTTQKTTKAEEGENVPSRSKHNVDCGKDTSFVNTYKIARLKVNGKAGMQYKYSCNTLKSYYRHKTDCKSGTTGWTYQLAQNLKQHDLDCKKVHGSRSFMTKFQQQTSGSKMRYSYTCCKILVS